MRSVLKLKSGNILISEQKMAHYSTKGKRAVAAFLEQNSDRELTVEDIFASMGDAAPGQSSVYRILSSLVEEGKVRRERRDDGEGYLYQFAGDLGCDRHFHLKCVNCGKVVHLHCTLSDELVHHILDDHGFAVDSGKSVLYGKCVNCGGRI